MMRRPLRYLRSAGTHTRFCVPLFCYAAQATKGSGPIARLREVAWERELFIVCLPFSDAGGVPAIIQGFPDAVIAVADTNPPSLPPLDELRAARANRGTTLLLPSLLDDRTVRAAVETIEAAILGYLDAGS